MFQSDTKHSEFNVVRNGSDRGETERANDGDNNSVGNNDDTITTPPVRAAVEPTTTIEKEKTRVALQTGGFIGYIRSRKENSESTKKKMEQGHQEGQHRKPRR